MFFVYVNNHIVVRQHEEDKKNRLKSSTAVRNRAFAYYKNDYPKTRFKNFEELKDWRKDIAEEYLDNAVWQWEKASWFWGSKKYQERAYEIYKEEHPKTIYKGHHDMSFEEAWHYIDKVIAERLKRNKEFNKRRKEKIREKGALRGFFYGVTHLPKDTTI
ncbi:hypothetical protein HYFRA_00013174 [Hymenoscyphus fraxineus]|uniref:Uncharacterized protein n=1 Tax=Hymenoscyphus fraxineus TaxID=746836 RepID=A0A9N9PZN4_9HELO|nr:hypothetical protein HYFRA_00013174 [Hymenoscyphus fraxineus]